MTVAWYLAIGAILVTMALASTLVRRLPLTGSMVYFALGIVLGPRGVGLISLDIVDDVVLIEHVAEICVVVSLFTAGLKIRLPFGHPRWKITLRLAFLSMTLTVAGFAAVGLALGLPLGLAILLGAILAPTDPVLASDVQLREPDDADRVRFSLTSEASLNDGSAFPFVMLGLGLLGLHEIGPGGISWLAVDVAWAVVAGLAIGWAVGGGVGRLVLHLRRTHKEALGLDDFLTLGLIALAYGIALALHAYGFLAVFAAGYALGQIEQRAAATAGEPAGSLEVVTSGAVADVDELATDPEHAPAFMVRSVLGFNERLERMTEVVLVLLVGALASTQGYGWEALAVVLAGKFLIRPLAVMLGLLGSRTTRGERGLIAWFGIRGIGSLYYLAFAIRYGVAEHDARTLAAWCLAVVAASIVVHGVSVTPLMQRYQSRKTAGKDAREVKV